MYRVIQNFTEILYSMGGNKKPSFNIRPESIYFRLTASEILRPNVCSNREKTNCNSWDSN